MLHHSPPVIYLAFFHMTGCQSPQRDEFSMKFPVGLWEAGRAALGCAGCVVSPVLVAQCALV